MPNSSSTSTEQASPAWAESSEPSESGKPIARSDHSLPPDYLIEDEGEGEGDAELPIADAQDPGGDNDNDTDITTTGIVEPHAGAYDDEALEVTGDLSSSVVDNIVTPLMAPTATTQLPTDLVLDAAASGTSGKSGGELK